MATFKQLRRNKEPSVACKDKVNVSPLWKSTTLPIRSDLQKRHLCVFVPYSIFTTPRCKLVVPKEPDEDRGTTLRRSRILLHTDKIEIKIWVSMQNKEIHTDKLDPNVRNLILSLCCINKKRNFGGIEGRSTRTNNETNHLSMLQNKH